MTTKPLPSVDRLRELLRYDAESGGLTWRVGRKGLPAEKYAVKCKNKGGYVVVMVDRVLLRAHRVAWAIHHGYWPAGEIDHINGDRADNRLSNLRDVPRAMNAQNLRTPKKTNKLGILGVHQVEGRFVARVCTEGKAINLGRYGTAEEAREAYLAGKRRHHQGSTL